MNRRRKRLWVVLAIFIVPVLVMAYPVWETAKEERSARASVRQGAVHASPAAARREGVITPRYQPSAEDVLPASEADRAGRSAAEPPSDDDH